MTGTVAVPRSTDMQQGTVGSRFPFRRGRHLTKEAAMMQNLDLLDLFLLAGSLVYFGLLVLRRI